MEAFDSLFNQRDYAAAEKLLSPRYVQHGAHGEPGREELINTIKSLPPTLKYEVARIDAYGDFVVVHGKFSGFGHPRKRAATDVIRIENGLLAEHWDVSWR